MGNNANAVGVGLFMGLQSGLRTTSGSCEAAGFQGQYRTGERETGVGLVTMAIPLLFWWTPPVPPQFILAIMSLKF